MIAQFGRGVQSYGKPGPIRPPPRFVLYYAPLCRRPTMEALHVQAAGFFAPGALRRAQKGNCLMEDVYERLALHLDNLPAGFPRTASGVEMRILRRLFTPEQAELTLHLTLLGEEARVVAYRAGIPVAEAARRLEEMDRAGLIYSAQAAGKPIIVHVYAPWCPTCRAQEPILHKLEADPKFAGAASFRIDFDSQKDAVRALKATSQSTIIVFKGATEVGRSVGETSAKAITDVVNKAL